MRHGVYLLRGAGNLQDDLRAVSLPLDSGRDPQARLQEPVAVVCGEAAAWAYGFGELMAARHEFTGTTAALGGPSPAPTPRAPVGALSAVACHGPRACVAVGLRYLPHADPSALNLRWNGARWTL